MSEAVAHSVRVTTRCLTEDLGFDHADIETPVGVLSESGDEGRHRLLRALANKRGKVPEPTDEDILDGLQTGKIRMFPLRYGERLRGLTWFDQDNAVVWLVAAHLVHRSGDRDDSYPYFRSLPGRDLLPTQEDLALLHRDTADAAADAILDDIDPALCEALKEPGTEVRITIGPYPVRLVADSVVPPPPHLKIGISMRTVDDEVQPSPEVVAAIVSRCYRCEFAPHELPYATSTSFGSGEFRQDELPFEWFISGWETLCEDD